MKPTRENHMLFRLGVAAFAIAVSLPTARAETMVMANNNSDACDGLFGKLNDAVETLAAACTDVNSTLTDKKSRKQCEREALKCDDAEKDLYSSTTEDGDTNADDCEELKSKGCAYLAVGNGTNEYKQDKKEALERVHDLEKQRDDAAKKDNDATQKAQDQSDKMADEAMKNDQDYRKERKKLTDDMQKQLGDMDDQKAKAVKDAQGEYDKIDVEYIKMRDQVRRLQSSITNMTLAWNTQCRVAADGAAHDAEKALDDRMAKEDAIVRNFQFSSAAGKLKRALKQKRQKIINQYFQTLSRCKTGDIEPGASTKVKLDDAQNQLKDGTSEASDRSARLEKLRLQILDNLNQLQSSMGKKAQMLTQQTMEAISMMDQDHMMNSARLQQRQMQAQQNAMQNMMLNNQQSQHLQDQLDDAKKDLVNASTRTKCSLPMSAAAAAEKRKANMDAAKAGKYIDTACASFQAECVGQKRSGQTDAKWSLPQLCKDVANNDERSAARMRNPTTFVPGQSSAPDAAR